MSKKKHKKAGAEKRCLCGRCATDYEIAGYNIQRDYKDNNRHICDKCSTRYGYIYIIILNK